MDAFREKYQISEARCNALDESLKRQESLNQERTREIDQCRSDVEELKKALKSSENRVQQLLDDQTRLQSDAARRSDQFDAERAALESRVADLKESKAALESDGASKAKHIAELIDQRSRCETQFHRLQADHDAVQAALQQVQSDLSAATEAAAAMRSKIAAQEAEKKQV